MSLLDLLRPASHAEQIGDAQVVREQYRYWRIRIFYAMYVGYIFYYFSRKCLTFAMPTLIVDLGMSKSDLGILTSLMSVIYGISKFLSGVMADRSNPRFFMAFGLMVTGVSTIFFSLCSSLSMFAVFCALNGWFQGWGWPPCARLLTHWYSQKERGTWWGIWNTAHSIGLAMVAVLVAWIASHYGWRPAMYVPGILCIVAGFFLVNRLRDTPQSLGLPSIEQFRNDYPATSMGKATERTLSAKEILVQYILANRYMWILGGAYLFIYVIRQGMNDWGILYFCEVKGYSSMVASSCIVSFEAGGICGSLVAGWASDKIFGGKRGPINLLFSLGVVGALLLLWNTPVAGRMLDIILMFAIGFLVYGPQMVIGMAAAELSHKQAAGSATGFIGWIGYLGGAFAGYPLIRIAETWGWSAFFVSLIIGGIVAILLLAPLWAVRVHPKYATEERECASSTQA